MEMRIASIDRVDMSGMKVPIITLYKDIPAYPGKVVARIWEGTIPAPTDAVIVYNSVDDADQALCGFVKIARSPEDAPNIICSYIV